jgi:O-acetyl-ADP-ribose deacetylase (regulator of RNase III)
MMVKVRRMGARQLATHRSILIVDVERYGDPARTSAHQLALRQAMYRALRQSFTKARIRWASCTAEDRGDGVLVLVPPDVAKNLLASKVPVLLAEELERYNTGTPVETRVRLRMALHAGEVYRDAHGVVGAAIIRAFRLIEAPSLKSALRTSPGVVALIVSEWFYDEVIRHDVSAEPARFFRTRVAVKETVTTAWIRILGAAARDHAELPEPSPRYQTGSDRMPSRGLTRQPGIGDDRPVVIPQRRDGKRARLSSDPEEGSDSQQSRIVPENKIYLYRVCDRIPAARHPRIGIITGTIRRVRCAEIWVNPENTDMKMARTEEYSISAIVRYEGARRDSAGHVVDDIIADELARKVTGRCPVAAGTVITTSSGELARSHNVRYLIHVASVQGEPGTGYRQVRDVARCVTNVLAEADSLFTREQTRQPVSSILFPLLGTGQGGGNIINTAQSMLGSAADYLVSVSDTRITIAYFLAHTYSELGAYRETLKENPRFEEGPIVLKN